MRRSVAAALIPFALLAAAASPGGPDSSEADTRARYRAQGVAICTRELSPVRGMTDEDMGNFCGCTLDTYMRGLPTGALPAQDSAAFRAGTEPPLNLCMLRLPAAQAAEMRRRIYSGPMTAADRAAESAPIAAPAPTADPAPPAAAPGPGLVELIRSWGDTLPVWAWAGMGLLIIVLLFRAMFRRGDRNHLTGPPPSMRQSGPVRPRETDRL